MKKDLIKRLFLLLFVPLQLLSSTYEWHAQSNKQIAYTDEAIYLEYSCHFSDRAELYSIDFNPVTQNKNYTITLLSERVKIKNNKRINIYEFVAFVHTQGEITFEFDTTMKETNEDSIQNTVIGRDNEEYEEFTLRYIKQKALKIEILKSEKKVVGNLKFTIKKDDNIPKAFEPYHLEVLLEGNADFDRIKPIVFNIDNVKVFSQNPTKNIKLTKDGYEGTWSQKFAFVSEKDFKIPSFKIKYFNLQSKTIEEFMHEESEIRVKKGFTREELLDVEESSSDNSSSNFIYYLLTFIAGFLASKVKIEKYYNFSKKKESTNPFKRKIESLKSVEEIAFTLALHDSTKYRNIIKEIENRRVTSIKEVKKLIEY